MGCSSAKQQLLLPKRLQTVNGVLRITVINALIQRKTSSYFSMDPYIKIRISNQSEKTQVISKGGTQPVFNETFTFYINSCYKINGRFLQMELWDSNTTSDSLVGFGIVDIDPILIAKQPKSNMRIALNHQLQPAGIVNAVAQFKEQAIQVVSFRFQTASIRRKTSTISSMNCYVQITLGEQVLKTQKKKDTKEVQPVWVQEIFTFNVPKVLKDCLIQVFDDNEQVGSTVITVQELLKTTKQQSFDEQIDFQKVIAGTLKFQTIVGVNPHFSEPNTNHRKKKQAKQTKKE